MAVVNPQRAGVVVGSLNFTNPNMLATSELST